MTKYTATRLIWPLNLVDDESVGDLNLEVTDETFAYSSTNGAQKTVRVIKDRKTAKADEEKFSKEDFVARLKGGETWVLRKFSKKKCHRCFGDGKLGASEDLISCSDCKGKGILVEDLTVKW